MLFTLYCLISGSQVTCGDVIYNELKADFSTRRISQFFRLVPSGEKFDAFKLDETNVDAMIQVMERKRKQKKEKKTKEKKQKNNEKEQLIHHVRTERCTKRDHEHRFFSYENLTPLCLFLFHMCLRLSLSICLSFTLQATEEYIMNEGAPEILSMVFGIVAELLVREWKRKRQNEAKADPASAIQGEKGTT